MSITRSLTNMVKMIPTDLVILTLLVIQKTGNQQEYVDKMDAVAKSWWFPKMSVIAPSIRVGDCISLSAACKIAIGSVVC